MTPDVEPSTLEIEPQRGRDAFDEQPLPLEREFAREHMARCRRRPATERVHQRDQLRPQTRDSILADKATVPGGVELVGATLLPGETAVGKQAT